MDKAWVGEQHENQVYQLQTARKTAAIDHGAVRWCFYSSRLIRVERSDTLGDSAEQC